MSSQYPRYWVSIHASARDATNDYDYDAQITLVSIHASARDATYLASVPAEMSEFQSTRPRGTRRRQVSQPSGARSFNPRVRAGRDKQDKTIIIHAPVSIHASARDATRRRLWSCTSVRCFNPRVRAGRDDFTPVILRYTSVSIHASARDAVHHPPPLLGCEVSIHASARDATPRPDCGLQAPAVSIHASARDATHDGKSDIVRITVSIHASARDATKKSDYDEVGILFQSTRPRGTRRSSARTS